MKALKIFLILVIIPFFGFSQEYVTYNTGNYTVVDGDTLPIYSVGEAEVFGVMEFASLSDAINYTRLVRYVKKVYPIAKYAGILYQDYSDSVLLLSEKKDVENFTERKEEELKEQFTPVIKEMTTNQGIILVKLIDRETGYSSHTILKEFRGAFIASFWGVLAKMFKIDLKLQYDPKGEDVKIERIVRLIERDLI